VIDLQGFRALLDRADRLLDGRGKEYYTPVREIMSHIVLVPTGYKMSDITANLYETESGLSADPTEYPDTVSVVVHGHERGIPCYAPYFCHIYGYSPTGAEPPSFIKNWNNKWTPKPTKRTQLTSLSLFLDPLIQVDPENG
jgi:hypothetical protein